MEKKPPSSLTDILNDLVRFKTEKESQQEAEQKLSDKGRKLNQQAMNLLQSRGEPQTTHIGTAAGRGIIGARLELAHFLKTPEVEVDLNGQNVKMIVKENLSSGPNYRIYKSGVSILLSQDHSKEYNELFRIGNGGVTNWRGEPADFDQITTASQILKFIEDSLPERAKQSPSVFEKRKPKVSHNSL